MNWIKRHKFLTSIPILLGLSYIEVFTKGTNNWSVLLGFYILIGGVIMLVQWLRSKKQNKEENNAR